jgi:hypothetical protein
MIASDFANILRPDQKPRFVKFAVIIEIMMKDMAIGSNIPQIPERIIVNGEKSQKHSAQTRALCSTVLEEIYENSRYARARSPIITGCFRRK